MLTPALFLTAIASVDLTTVPFGSVAIALVVPILVASLLVLLAKRLIRATGPEITSLLQGAIRFNTYTGLIFAAALAGRMAWPCSPGPRRSWCRWSTSSASRP